MTSSRDRDDLERRLQRLAASIETTAPDDYPDRVRQALSQPGRVRASYPTHRVRRVAIAAAALVAIVVALAIPASRSAIASWFGFAGIEITHTPPSATPSPQPTGTAPFGAGTPVSLPTAERAMGGSLGLPALLSAPDDVLLDRDGDAVVVTLAYRSAFGLPRTPDTGYALVVTEIAHAGEPLFEKILDTEATALAVTVGERHPGVYIAGPQWIISMETSGRGSEQSRFHEIDPRTSANTLIWNDGAVTYRIEGDFSQKTALDIAGRFR